MNLDLIRDSSKTFPEVPDAERVTAARLWHCEYRSLDRLREFRNLTTLLVATFPDDSFNVFESLPNLTYLSVLHLPQVSSLEPVAACERLETLRLHTLPSWDPSGKKTTVESLAPLGRLQRLRHVELFGVVPRDNSLSPLQRCSALTTARFQGYPKREVARFYEATDVNDAFAPDSGVEGW